jgi:tryptophanase
MIPSGQPSFPAPCGDGAAIMNLVGHTVTIPLNYHFTTTRARIELAGATVLEPYEDEALV